VHKISPKIPIWLQLGKIVDSSYEDLLRRFMIISYCYWSS